MDSEIQQMRQQKITTVMLEPYMDQALTPVVDDETETLEMFTHNEGSVSPRPSRANLRCSQGAP